MFCPNCGIDEKQPNQFCRACGTNLLPVREVVEKPDGITASAITAREDIGRAVAAKIRETDNVYDLKKVAEDVLPQIEKFLESPEEKRLRRIRLGTLLSCIGFGVAVAVYLDVIFSGNTDLSFLAVLGLVNFFIGLGFIINGYLLTVPKKSLPDKTGDAVRQRELDGASDLSLQEPASLFPTETENATQPLTEKQPVQRG